MRYEDGKLVSTSWLFNREDMRDENVYLTVTVSRPATKKGRGQRKNRRDAAGRYLNRLLATPKASLITRLLSKGLRDEVAAGASLT